MIAELGRVHIRITGPGELPARWAVAHCCQIIYLSVDQDQASMITSGAAALAELRERTATGGGERCAHQCLPHPTDELAARREQHRRRD